MWNFVNTMGHPGHFMGPQAQANQKRQFSIQVQNLPIVPGKTFTNPNFVNKHHPSVHSYQNNFISTPLQKICHIDSPNVNSSKSFNTNSALVNSSQSIIDTIIENQLDVVKRVEPNCTDVKPETEPTRRPAQMCYNVRRNRRNRRRKTPGKNSRQNTHIQQIHDMMDIDVDMDSSLSASDVNMSPKFPNNTFSLTDFIVERPNKSKSLIDDKSPCDSDNEDLLAISIISISPPNNQTCRRERTLSIAESEDSFIVFDSGTDEELEFTDESDEESEDSDEEDVDSSSSVIPHKRVRFAEDTDLCEIHPMVQWSYAYQQARKGPWEEYARDRDRFQKRIANTEKILSPVFDATHRQAVFEKRFNDPSFKL